MQDRLPAIFPLNHCNNQSMAAFMGKMTPKSQKMYRSTGCRNGESDGIDYLWLIIPCYTMYN